MLRYAKILLLALVLTASWVGLAGARHYPAVDFVGDLSGDCKVGWEDLRILAEQWLNADCSAPDCEADLDGVPGVNMFDFGVLADNWRKDYSEITLVINEFMASNNSDSGIRDEWGDYDDWIEIYNYGSEAINIGGMCFKDDFNGPSMWMVPTNDPTAPLIPAGGFLIIWADDETSEGTLHASFKLSASDTDEDICLFDRDASTIIDAIFNFNDPTPQEQNKSYGRLPDGSDNWQVFDNPTPGKSNGAPPPSIIISEIMYHPYHNSLVYEPENLGEEYIELFNRGTESINLSGWQFSDGVEFVFPNDVTLDPCEYLVVAADAAVFTAKYPSVSNVISGWTGKLRNKGEKIELVNEVGKVIDSVRYADEGEWAVRELGPVDNLHRGWSWSNDHDGVGKSLELINMSVSNEYGQNWAASTAIGGSPGGANAVAAGDIAPLILDMEHNPIIPRDTDTVTVTARIIDELSSGITATLYYRVDTSTYINEDTYPTHIPATYTTVTMYDDGLHNDGEAGNGVYGAEIPVQADGTIIELYVEASDSGAKVRTWPAASDMSSIGAGMQQVTNLLYQVNDSYDPGAEWSAESNPIFYLIMTEAERARLADIGDDMSDERYSDAQMNGTFISIDGVDMKKRYTVGIRNRGESSRGQPPNNYRVNFRHDDEWKNITAIKINSKYTYLQVVGYAIFRMAGILSAEASAVDVRVNGTNLALTDQARMYGAYTYLEVYDGDWAENHIPDDSGGNMYKAAYAGGWNAKLTYLGTNPADYEAVGYFKQTNESENDWTDLFDLTNVLDNEPDITYVAEVNRVINPQQWVRWFALNSLLGNNENGLATGVGEDYRIYRGMDDTRFQLLAHDLDTILHVAHDIPAIDRSIFYIADRGYMPLLDRFIKHPEFVREYYAQFMDLIETTCAAENFDPLMDEVLGDWLPTSSVNEIKQKMAERITYVLGEIPLDFTISSGLSTVNGFYYTTSSVTSLSGTANSIETYAVRINGVMADNWSVLDGDWSIGNSISLNPGINRITVQTFDEPNGTGNELQRGYIDIWYDDGDESTVSAGMISSNTTWDAASGPWHVTGDVAVPDSNTLTIEAGTTLFFDAGTGITVQPGGRLLAEGTEYERICLTRVPGSGSYWDGMKFNNTLEDNRLAYVDHEFGAGQGEAIDIQYSRVTIDNMSWAETNNNAVAYMEHPQVTISNSYIPGISGEPIHGIEMVGDEYLILKGNVFAAGGGNDIVDWDGTGSDKIYFFALNNIFLGGGDDGLDMDATDAYIEGNIFMNFHSSDPGTTTSNAIAGGKSYHSNTNLPDLTIVRNIFINNDHGILIKEGGYVTVLNNVFADSNYAAIQFCENGRNVNGPGSGAYIDGSIFWKYVRPFKYLIWEPDLDPETDWPADPNVTVNNSIITDENYPGSDNLLGGGNINADPLFVDELSDFHLKYMSPAIGTGPCGLDMGAYVPAGAAICGEPDQITYHTEATLTVGGPGITHYKYSLNDPNGSWSTELSVDVPIELTGLANGNSYTVYVIGKNSAGVWQSQDDATASRTWTVDTSYSRLVINEVLAHTHGADPDIIELYYDGPTALDLSDMSLTDEPGHPRKFVFSSNTVTSTTMGPGSDYMILYGDLTHEPNHLGFALSAEGEGLYLYDKPANGGGLLDSVEFGPQLNDFSIGRIGYGGTWKLNQPTFGQANIVQPLGDPATLKINEWLANEEVLFEEDFIELYNPDALPVDLSELYLTDNPVTQPAKQWLGPLSFAPPNGYAVFIADDTNAPGHLDFKLSADAEIIGLFDAHLNEIDKVLYGPQTTDVSQGRTPNGADSFEFFELPTPHVANPSGPTVTVTNLIAIDDVWSYEQSNTDLGTAWRAPDYDDLSWPTRQGAAVRRKRRPARAQEYTTDARRHHILLPDTLYVRR